MNDDTKPRLAPCPVPGCGRQPRFEENSEYWLCDELTSTGGSLSHHRIEGPNDDPTGAGWNAAYGRESAGVDLSEGDDKTVITRVRNGSVAYTVTVPNNHGFPTTEDLIRGMELFGRTLRRAINKGRDNV